MYRLQGSTAARGFYTKNYLTRPQKVIRLTAPVGFGTTKRLGFPLLVGIPLKPRVRLFFLDERAVLLTVEDDERVRGGKALC